MSLRSTCSDADALANGAPLRRLLEAEWLKVAATKDTPEQRQSSISYMLSLLMGVVQQWGPAPVVAVAAGGGDAAAGSLMKAKGGKKEKGQQGGGPVAVMKQQAALRQQQQQLGANSGGKLEYAGDSVTKKGDCQPAVDLAMTVVLLLKAAQEHPAATSVTQQLGAVLEDVDSASSAALLASVVPFAAG
eukprot:gene8691-8872_t